MFNQSKYTQWYNNIIESARIKPHNGYTETHHIIPKSLGGSNDKSNLIELSARQHFIAHLLLPKMTTGSDKSKMWNAIRFLVGNGKGGKRTEVYKPKASIFYSRIKEEFSIINSKLHRGKKRPPRSEEYKEKQRKSHLGKNNGRHKGMVKTPWGIYESFNLAADACPDTITGAYINLACQKNNNKPISYLSVCRSKGFLKKEHVGKTPKELGFELL